MERYYPRLAVIFAVIMVVLLVAPAPAQAQFGACPPGTLLLGSPTGTHPANTIFCAETHWYLSVRSTNPETYPCAQHILHNNSLAPPAVPHEQQELFVVPAIDNYLGQRLRIRFFIFTRPRFIGIMDWRSPGFVIDDVTMIIRYFDINGVSRSTSVTPLSAYRRIDTWYNDGIGDKHYYPVYLVDQYMFAAGAGGYLTIKMVYPDDLYEHDHLWMLSSLHVGNEYDAMPQHCDIPNAALPGEIPPTPTPLATWTPNPEATATPPPRVTPGATAPGTTPMATWTATPITFPTTRAESTPTPWAPVVLPTVRWPTPGPTTIWADSGGGGDGGDLGLGGLVDTINNSWQPAIDGVDDWADPNSTSATGNVAPVETALEMANNIGRPVAYLKAVSEYMPNAGPYITYLLMLVGFVAFNIMSKFSLSLSARILEIIRRILELIPGM